MLLTSEEGRLEGNAWDNGLWFDQSRTKWADCGLISLGQSGWTHDDAKLLGWSVADNVVYSRMLTTYSKSKIRIG